MKYVAPLSWLRSRPRRETSAISNDHSGSPVRIVPWKPADLRRRLFDAMAIYTQAMGYPVDMGEQRAGYTISHTHNPGFLAAAALTSSNSVVGFGYGYRTQPGQWWHDQARSAMTAKVADEWLTNSFELCELHVLPHWQGHRIGRQLLRSIADRTEESRIVLSTPEGQTIAQHFYRSLGFVDVVRNHQFPGDDRPFAILGTQLPLNQGS